MKNQREILEIIVHCSYTTIEMNTSVAEVRRWHVEDNGWSDIGYHIYIDVDGNVFYGRPTSRMGAGVLGHNRNSIHICYSGGAIRNNGKLIYADTRTPNQKSALRDMIMFYKVKHPKAIVYGHNDFDNRACPCFDAKKEYLDISNKFSNLI